MSTPTFTLSHEQEEILSALANPNSGHLCIDAKAGAAKTTTIELGAGKVPEKYGLAIAFNKSIADTLGEKLPDNITCKTFHALAFAAWKRKAKAKHVVNKWKLWELSRELWADEYDKETLDEVRDIANAARTQGLVPAGASPLCNSVYPDSIDEWTDLADGFGFQEPKAKAALARELVRASIKETFRGNLDFTDMIYMPVVTNAAFDKFPIVFVDEAQDLNPLQHIILTKSLAPAGRCVFVGDPHQSIYGFAGAATGSMEILKTQLSATTYPLNTSFRCASTIIAEAQQIVPDITAWEQSPAGLVQVVQSWNLEDIGAGDAVLCRNNAPLVALATNLIKQGILASIKGADIGNSATKLVEKLCQGKPLTADALGKRVLAWITTELESGCKYPGAKVDRASCILILCNTCEDSAEVIDQIDRIFNRKYPGAVHLSSVHRAKGLEWERVFILDQHLMPSKYAKTVEALEQEDNLRYVAITRAKRELYYITSADCTTKIAHIKPEDRI